jgi:hypothetical protein
MLLVGSMTDWRMSLMRLIPLRMHLAGDLMLGAVLLLSPLVFGFADEGARPGSWRSPAPWSC